MSHTLQSSPTSDCRCNEQQRSADDHTKRHVYRRKRRRRPSSNTAQIRRQISLKAACYNHPTQPNQQPKTNSLIYYARRQPHKNT